MTKQVGNSAKDVVVDPAYDIREIYDAVMAIGANVVVPPIKGVGVRVNKRRNKTARPVNKVGVEGGRKKPDTIGKGKSTTRSQDARKSLGYG